MNERVQDFVIVKHIEYLVEVYQQLTVSLSIHVETKITWFCIVFGCYHNFLTKFWPNSLSLSFGYIIYLCELCLKFRILQIIYNSFCNGLMASIYAIDNRLFNHRNQNIFKPRSQCPTQSMIIDLVLKLNDRMLMLPQIRRACSLNPVLNSVQFQKSKKVVRIDFFTLITSK